MTDHHADRPHEVRAFFASRAATWDAKFPDDGPAYAAGVAELGLQEGERVLDMRLRYGTRAARTAGGRGTARNGAGRRSHARDAADRRPGRARP